MDNEPTKNEQFDEDMEDTVRQQPEMDAEQKPAAPKKRIPSFEDIIAGQEKPVEAPREYPAVSADGEVENEKPVDPLETVKELKLAISKAEAELAPEEIESLLSAEAHEQLETDEPDDIDPAGQNEEAHTLLEPKENISINRIPRFELTEQILSEQRKAIAGRRRKPSGATQSGDRAGIHGILGEVVRAGRSRKAEAPAARQPSGPPRKITLTPAVYSILKGESGLTQIQRKIISDIVTHDIAEHYADINSAPAYKQA